MTKMRVIADYLRTYESPIVARAGDAVRLVKRDDDEPGWKWCEHPVSGLAGWVPEVMLDVLGVQAVVTRDYKAMELTVAAGAIVEVTETVAGWSFCTDSEAGRGWVPALNLAWDA